MADLFKLTVFAFLFYTAFIFIPSLIADDAATPLVKYESGERRDPFTPLIGPGGMVLQEFNPNDLKVEGIIYDPLKGSLALINGEFYKKGDVLKEITITKILKDRVVVTKDNEEKVLWIRDESEQQGELSHETKEPTPSKQ